MRQTPIQSERRPAFTLLELTVVAALTGFMLLLISGLWHGFGRSMTDAVARSRVALEASLALESLSRDLAGNLPDQISGGKRQDRLVGQMVAAGPELRLCFDGDADQVADWGPPDTVVAYRVESGRLVRSIGGSSSVVVADGVEQMQLTTLADGIQIDLTVSYRDLDKTYSFVTSNP
jgi:type II secretory pathway pseudopilin PulG